MSWTLEVGKADIYWFIIDMTAVNQQAMKGLSITTKRMALT